MQWFLKCFEKVRDLWSLQLSYTCPNLEDTSFQNGCSLQPPLLSNQPGGTDVSPRTGISIHSALELFNYPIHGALCHFTLRLALCSLTKHSRQESICKAAWKPCPVSSNFSLASVSESSISKCYLLFCPSRYEFFREVKKGDLKRNNGYVHKPSVNFSKMS